MAETIKIVGDILNTNTFSRYSDKDLSLVDSKDVVSDFGNGDDYIEFYVMDSEGNILNSDYDYLSYKIRSEIEIDPIQDLQDQGYDSGEFLSQYNLFRNILSNSEADMFVKEISSDRTEVRLSSTVISNTSIEKIYNDIVKNITSTEYTRDYLLNFGNNRQLLTVNVALLDGDILFKLYEPLPDDIEVKDTLWVVEEIANPYIFDLNLDILIIPAPSPQLRGANFNIKVAEQNTTTTGYEDYSSLVSVLESTRNSTYNQLRNIMDEKGIDINVDYADFSNFSFFGSVKTRIQNFYDKVKQIEEYTDLINQHKLIVDTNPSVLVEINLYTARVADITSGFDPYEKHLYFNSGSTSYPKLNNTLPYIQQPTESDEVKTWYANTIKSASEYDEDNLNRLINLSPSYLIDDENNEQYLVFMDMMGHYFDNIWIYLNSITDINKADNNTNKGISKDLVYSVLRSYGIKLYNSEGNEDLDKFLIGKNSGSVEFIDDFSAESEYLNNIPRKDLITETHKRIYNNLPYLVKTKGTLAGLSALVSIFGITGSVLSVKEYGEFDEKVRLTDNNVDGNVLSPFVKVHDPNYVKEIDTHHVDISFSPQHQINTQISGSIDWSLGSFNIDDYIGNPNELHSKSYKALDKLRKEHTSQFTAGLMNPNEFIRLIQYFDNSLFKMLEDFVPARTSLSTGITISTHMLERNKIVFGDIRPTSTESIKDANISTAEINGQYGKLFDQLEGDKREFYNGELEGANINIHEDYFEPNNKNPYLHPTSSLNANDINIFEHSEYNVMLNNIKHNRKSVNRKRLEYLPNGIPLYIPTEVQDLTLTSHNNARYNGVKLFSAKYNEYTEGDKSFGKSPVIEHYVRKIGLFTQITSNIFLINNPRNNVALKYLIDEKGQLTELNQKNNHWEEVQNTFKSNEFMDISLFDNQKFSNQKSLDGSKFTYNSGYSYHPTMYFSASFDSKLYFQYNATNVTKIFKYENTPGGFIAGGGNNKYAPVSGNIHNIFDVVVYNDGNYYTPGVVGSSFPEYNVPENSSYKFISNFNVNVDLKQAAQTIGFSYELKKNGALVTGSTQTFTSVKEYNNPVNVDTGFNKYCPDSPDSLSGILYALPLINEPVVFVQENGTKTTFPANTEFWAVDAEYEGMWGVCDTGVYINGTFPVIVSYTSGSVKARLPGVVKSAKTYDVSEYGGGSINIVSYDTYTGAYTTNMSNNVTKTFMFNLETNMNEYASGDKMTFELKMTNTPTSAYTASVTQGLNTVSLSSTNTGAVPYATSSGSAFVSSSVSPNELTLNSSLSGFKGYIFMPQTGSISLYNKYGDVDNEFDPISGDKLILSHQNQTTEYDIISVSYNSGKMSLKLSPDLPSSLIGDLVNNIDQVLILKKVKDETNAIIKFNKRDGQTSYGFVIPKNLHPDVLKNIDTITKEVKQKLLTIQSE